MSDSVRATDQLSNAMDALTASAGGLSQGFAELAENGKVWTIVSRVISGTGMWQLQNKIRALGQTMFYWNSLQEKGLENQKKSLAANMKLAKSYKDMANAMKKSSADIEKTDLYQMYFNMAKMQGRSDPRKFAMAQYKKQFGDMKGKLGTAMEDAAKPNRTMQYLRGANVKKNKAGRFYDSNTGRLMAKADVTTRGEFLKETFTKGPVFGSLKKFADGEIKLSRIRKRILKVGKLIAPTLGRLVLVASAFFVKAVMYFLIIALAITLIVKIFRTAWPSIKKMFEKFGVVTTLINGIKLVLGGFFQMVKGIFKGNFGDVVKGFLSIMLGLGKILFAMLKGVAALVIGLVVGLFKAIANNIIGKLHNAPVVGGFFSKKLKKFAMGGVTSGGMALVGERGPELVNLPAGARVHSNQASRRMGGGNTIHVHVNGRVGASDMEIRDIADKVAREINMRMNRTGSAVGRF